VLRGEAPLEQRSSAYGHDRRNLTRPQVSSMLTKLALPYEGNQLVATWLRSN